MQTPEKAPAAKLADTPEKVEPEHILALAPNGKEVLSKLVGLDEKYLVIEKDYDAEVTKLIAQYQQKYAPLLAARAEKVKSLPGFWSAVLQRSDEIGGEIEEHDVPVLAALQDIRYESLPNSEDWKLHFHFAENEYFTNKVLTKTYRMGKQNEWSTDLEFTKVESDTIEWKEGKDVTVEKVAKKVKGGGKKKAKAKAKAELVPRASFFRFFRTVGEGCDLPTDVEDSDSDEDEEEDDEEKMEALLSKDTEMAEALKDNILPHAVRYFTHEAGDDESDEEDEDDEAATPKTPGQEEEDDLSDTPP